MSRWRGWGWLWLLFGGAVAPGARANMAKWWSDGEAHGALVPRDDTDIRVDSEDLTFDVAPTLASAEVTATYRMTNGATTETRADVAFVMVASADARRDLPGEAPVPSITVDGVPVESRVVTNPDARMLRDWATRSYDAPLSWLTFPLTMPAGATRTVTVRYTHIAGSDARRAVNPVFTYDYLLSPAKRWAHFGELHIDVRAPADTELVTSSISLIPEKDGYRAALSGLPSGELGFELMSRRGLLFGMTQPIGYWLILLAAMAIVTLAASARLGRVWTRRGPRIFGTGVAALGWNTFLAWALSKAFPQGAFGFSYNAMFGLVGAIGMFTLVAIVVAGMASKSKKAAA